ncbi:MAG: hypothetical protein J7L11_08820 [Thermoprotei archaeon]|nr:hypothetical protein [Thermoprotei archaeon]
MKVVQTKLTNIEYELLRRYAESKGLTIMEAVREIIRKSVLEDRVYPDDPIFVEKPAAKRRGVMDRTSVEHDRVLYGENQ